MNQEKLKKVEEDVAELKRLLDCAERQRVRDILSIEVRKLETELLQEKERLGPVLAETTRSGIPPAGLRKEATAYDVQVKNFSWDQSDKFVKIYLTGLANVQLLPEDSIIKQFSKTSVEIKIPNLGGKNYVFTIKETGEKIDPEKSYFRVKSDMVVIFLCKLTSGKEWKHLKAVEKAAAKEKFSAPKDDAGADPSASLMNMMKQMYEEGDDDMKRTIAKAWTESRNKQGPMDSL